MKRKLSLFLLGLVMLYLGFTSSYDWIMGTIFIVFGFGASMLAILAK